MMIDDIELGFENFRVRVVVKVLHKSVSP